MPYCSNCGDELKENADICLSCGILVEKNMKYHTQPTDGTTLGIIGLCFALFIPLVTWIVSGIGYSQANQADNKNAKTINLIALIVSSVAAFFYFILSLT